MNILHINTNYIGNPLHQNMIESLMHNGVNNSVFAPVYNASDASIVPKDYVTVSECFKKIDRINYFFKQKKIIAALKKTHDVKKFDCIHAYTVFTDGNVAYKLSKEYNIPYVVAVRNTDINTFFKFMPHLRKKGVEILKNASAVFFLSPVYKKRLFEKYINEKDRVTIEAKSYIMPNGLDSFWLNNVYENRGFDSLDKTLKVVCVGVVDKNKNMISVAEALNKIKQKGEKVSLSIAGKIKSKSVYNRLLKYDFVEYMGILDKNQLLELYRKSDVFALCSFHESFGMVYIEAMSQGLPVIYTENEGFDGHFEDGVVGYKVNPLDVREIANRIMMVYRNKEFLSSNALKSVDRYSWNILTKKYKDIYQKTIN